MNGLSDLRLLERQAFRRFYDDGLVDLFFGLMLATMGIGALVTDRLDSEAAGLVVMLGVSVVLLVALTLTRRRLLRTRLGTFKPGTERRSRIRASRLALLGSVVVGVVACAFAAAAAYGGISLTSVEVVVSLLWFVNAAVVMGAMAYFLDVPRFYLYGVLFGLVMPLLVWPDALWGIELPVWLATGIPASVMVLMGLLKLTRFVRDYPPLPTLEKALYDHH